MHFLNTFTVDYVVQLGHNETTAARVIKNLKSSWINQKTRTVTLEFAIYNPGTQMIVVIAYVHEFVGTGGFTVYENIHVLQLQATESLFFFYLSIVIVFIHCLLLCFTVCFNLLQTVFIFP